MASDPKAAGAQPAAERHHHFHLLEHLGELVALSGPCANGAVLFAEFGAEQGHGWTFLEFVEIIVASKAVRHAYDCAGTRKLS